MDASGKKLNMNYYTGFINLPQPVEGSFNMRDMTNMVVILGHKELCSDVMLAQIANYPAQITFLAVDYFQAVAAVCKHF